MPISPYLRELRARVGSARLLVPAVTALIRDGEGRVLLVRQREGAVWSTPGGAIEPDETPADAVVREAWEETGLRVEPTRVAAVHGGPSFLVRYANGDEVQYVSIVFECAMRGGELRGDGSETLDVRFWAREEAERLELAAWLRPVLSKLYDTATSTSFDPPCWTPPT